MAKDLVCGMEVEATAEAVQTTYRDKTYYFCSEECKGTFEQDLAKYTPR